MQTQSNPFKHLEITEEGYLSHLKKNCKYALVSMKASFMFFIHGIWPDVFVYDASETLINLNHEIIDDSLNS